MDYQALANDILTRVGGKKNIISAGHCATRLRINAANTKIVNKDEIQVLKGVIGVAINGNQVQVVIGQDVPNLREKCFAEHFSFVSKHTRQVSCI